MLATESEIEFCIEKLPWMQNTSFYRIYLFEWTLRIPITDCNALTSRLISVPTPTFESQRIGLPCPVQPEMPLGWSLTRRRAQSSFSRVHSVHHVQTPYLGYRSTFNCPSRSSRSGGHSSRSETLVSRACPLYNRVLIKLRPAYACLENERDVVEAWGGGERG